MENNLFLDSALGYEYRRAILMNCFAKMCLKIDKDDKFSKHVSKLYLNSFNKSGTIASIFCKEFGCKLSISEEKFILDCFEAHRHRNRTRKKFTLDFKEHLLNKQNWKCAICNSPIDISAIHVDHIVPWVLVGDCLIDNYQALCSNCNLKKSSSMDYIFRSKLGLV